MRYLLIIFFLSNVWSKQVTVKLRDPLNITKKSEREIYGTVDGLDADTILVGKYTVDRVKDDIRLVRFGWVALKNKNGWVSALKKPLQSVVTG